MLYSMAEILFIKFRISVFGISKQWMSCSCQMSTDLVSTSCDKFHFQKCHFFITAKRTVACFDGQGIFKFLSAHSYFVCFFVFVQITFDVSRFFYSAFCETKIIFVKRSVMENPGQKLQTCKAFTCTDHSTGIAVKTVAY